MKSFIFMVAAAALLTVGPASAATAADTSSRRDEVSIVVRYPTLDLQNPQGARTLAGRITEAARVICGAEPRYISLQHPQYATCVHEVAGKAVRRVGAPLLTAAYEGQGQPLRLALH
jgi:UrcA family protein